MGECRKISVLDRVVKLSLLRDCLDFGDEGYDVVAGCVGAFLSLVNKGQRDAIR